MDSTKNYTMFTGRIWGIKSMAAANTKASAPYTTILINTHYP